MFISLSNFYQRFIQSFNKIAILLILLLKIIRLLDLALKTFRIDNKRIIEVDNKTNKIAINSFKNNNFKKLLHMPNIKAIKKLILLTFNAKKTFNHLR